MKLIKIIAETQTLHHAKKIVQVPSQTEESISFHLTQLSFPRPARPHPTQE